ncbi:hypothetical protein BN129_2015 [Cronobacter sakazakii 701]|nr:hypothetical protein BN129_2015 [Cronobacter sakazakii 701]
MILLEGFPCFSWHAFCQSETVYKLRGIGTRQGDRLITVTE